MWRSTAATKLARGGGSGATLHRNKVRLIFESQASSLLLCSSDARVPSKPQYLRFFSNLSATPNPNPPPFEPQHSSHQINNNDFRYDPVDGHSDVFTDTHSEASEHFWQDFDGPTDPFAPGDRLSSVLPDGFVEEAVGFGAGDENENDKEHPQQQIHQVDRDKLEQVLSLLQSSVDGSLEATLETLALHLHQDFVLQVLQTPLISSSNFIRFFTWTMKKLDFNVTTPVLHALVLAISSDLRSKDVYAVWDLVQEIGDRDPLVLSVEILNKLIALFSKMGAGKAALQVFNKFEDFGFAPDSHTYYHTIEALHRRSIFDSAWSVCEKMLDAGALPDSEKVGKIMSWFCKASRAKEAHQVYVLAKEKNKNPPLPAVNFLIGSLCRKDETVKLAEKMLDDISGKARKYAIKPYSSVVRSLCRIKDVNGAKDLISRMMNADGPPPGNAVFNMVINGYSKVGDMEKAVEMMRMMESRGLKPDVYTYTVIMSGYASGGQMEEACKILSELKKKHSKLTPVTYHTLIRGYCKLEQFDKALELLREMTDFGVQPNVDEYNKLIQSLCLKALDWETAQKLLEEMKDSGLHLNGITRSLIRAVKELEEDGLEQ